MIIDMHAHIVAAGDEGHGCFLSERRKKSLVFRLLRILGRVPRRDFRERLSEAYRARLVRDLAAAPGVDRVVLYAHDRIYEPRGAPDPRTEIYVSNDYVLALAREHPKILAGASVHPYRPDALSEIERCTAAGAVLFKALPDSMGFDPADTALGPYYDAIAASGRPLVLHTGGEHMVRRLVKSWADPRRLRLALDRGVTVIAAHCGTSSGLFDRDYLPHFRRMLEEHPRLFGDTAAFAAPFRAHAIPLARRDPGFAARLVHGSDYPIMGLASVFAGRLGPRRALEIEKIPSYFEKDLQLKRALGIPEPVFHRAADLLPL